MWRVMCLLLLLTSCGPTTSAGYRAIANDIDAAAYQAAQSTEQARLDLAAERTAQAQATSYAIDADRQQLAVTQTAQEMQATAFASTATAWIGTTEANAYLTNLEANQQADATRIAREQRDAEIDMGLANAAWILVLLIGYVVVILSAMMGGSLILERYRRATWRYNPAQIIDAPPTAPQMSSGKGLSLNDKAIILLSRAATFAGEHGATIRRWEPLGYTNPHERQEVIDAMEKYNLVTVSPSGTKVIGKTVQELLNDFLTGKVGLM